MTSDSIRSTLACVSLAAAGLMGCTARIDGVATVASHDPAALEYYLPGGGATTTAPSNSSSWVGACDGSNVEMKMELFSNGSYTAAAGDGGSFKSDNGTYAKESGALVFRDDVMKDTAMTCTVDTKEITFSSGKKLSQTLRCGLNARASTIAFFSKCTLAHFARAEDVVVIATPSTNNPERTSTTCAGSPGCPESPGASALGALGTESSSWEGACDAGMNQGDRVSLVLTSAGKYSGSVGSLSLVEGSYFVKGQTITGVFQNTTMVALTCARGANGKELKCLFDNVAGASQCGTIDLHKLAE